MSKHEIHPGCGERAAGVGRDSRTCLARRYPQEERTRAGNISFSLYPYSGESRTTVSLIIRFMPYLSAEELDKHLHTVYYSLWGQGILCRGRRRSCRLAPELSQTSSLLCIDLYRRKIC